LTNAGEKDQIKLTIAKYTNDACTEGKDVQGTADKMFDFTDTNVPFECTSDFKVKTKSTPAVTFENDKCFAVAGETDKWQKATWTGEGCKKAKKGGESSTSSAFSMTVAGIALGVAAAF